MLLAKLSKLVLIFINLASFSLSSLFLHLMAKKAPKNRVTAAEIADASKYKWTLGTVSMNAASGNLEQYAKVA